jgi:fibronectin-binding autotransporter adhesin
MANRYWVGGNANWDGTAGTKWATTSGGAGGAAVPTASDDVFLDNGTGTGNVTVNATSVCKSLTCTGYIGTFTMSAQLTVSGSVTFVAGMTLAGSSTFIVSENGTLTSNGKTIPFPLALSPGTGGGCTYTLADDWTCSSTVTVGSANSTGSGCIINGNHIYSSSNFTSTAVSSRTVSGTTEFVITAGSLGGTTNIQNNITIAGNVTLGNLTWGGATTFKRTSGTVTVTSATTLTLNALGGTLDLSSVTLQNLTHTGGSNPTYTLLSDITVAGTYTTTAGAPIWNTSTGKKLYLSTLVESSSTNVTGTATIEFYATGTWSSTGASQIRNNLVFNTGAGTTTISGNIYYSLGTMTYTSGTVVTTGSTLNLATVGTYVLNTAGITWNNITITGSNPVVTINSLLTATGTLTTSGVSGSVTFNGTHGFTVGTWIDTTGGMTITLAASKTYTVTTSLTLIGSSASPIILNSSTPSTAAIFTLNSGASQAVGLVSATDIDSSLGQTVFDFSGTLLRTSNWVLLTTPRTVAKTFVG